MSIVLALDLPTTRVQTAFFVSVTEWRASSLAGVGLLLARATLSESITLADT